MFTCLLPQCLCRCIIANKNNTAGGQTTPQSACKVQERLHDQQERSETRVNTSHVYPQRDSTGHMAHVTRAKNITGS